MSPALVSAALASRSAPQHDALVREPAVLSALVRLLSTCLGSAASAGEYARAARAPPPAQDNSSFEKLLAEFKSEMGGGLDDSLFDEGGARGVTGMGWALYFKRAPPPREAMVGTTCASDSVHAASESTASSLLRRSTFARSASENTPWNSWRRLSTMK